jgi:hypothetical protein
MPFLVRAGHVCIGVECFSTFGIGILGKGNFSNLFIQLATYIHEWARRLTL